MIGETVKIALDVFKCVRVSVYLLKAKSLVKLHKPIRLAPTS